METSVRFENAVSKLYNAFHKNELDAWDCEACAVGNICDGNARWVSVRLNMNSPMMLMIFGRKSFIPRNYIGKAKMVIDKTGYSPLELLDIEKIFLSAIGFNRVHSKESQFRGLCAVIEYLCELEGIPNIMDYTSLFETEDDKPKRELTEVFV